MLSFWEKRSFIHFDYIIVGSGIVGLSTAASIIEKKKKAKVLVLERGLLPTGASTKNAGFACFGSPTELLADLKVMSENRVLELVELRYKGITLLRRRLGDKKIGYIPTGGYELLFEAHKNVPDAMSYLNRLLWPVFKNKAFKLRDQLISQLGFSPSVKHLIYMPFEAQIDTGQMMSHLKTYVSHHGVSIITGAKVEGIEVLHNKVILSVYDNVLGAPIDFWAEKVAVCTNAFTIDFFPGLDIRPGRGQVLITKPIEKLPFQGVFHFDEGFYYFRNVGKRVLIGGGRNLDVQGETTTILATTSPIISELEDKLQQVILPGKPYVVEQTWSGIMAFGKEKFPILQQYNDRVIVSARMGGMGVAIGSEWGARTAKLLLKK